jgi:hypothetical protein
VATVGDVLREVLPSGTVCLAGQVALGARRAARRSCAGELTQPDGQQCTAGLHHVFLAGVEIRELLILSPGA